MESEDLFEEDFSEDIINEIEKEYAVDGEDVNEEIIEESEENIKEQESEEPHSDLAACNESLNVMNESSNNTVNTTAKSNISKSSSASKLFQLPLTRVRNLMKLDPDLHIASNEAVFGVTRATELFIESLAREAYSYTAQAKKKTVQKRDIDLAIASVDSLMFLDGAMNF